jgi:glycerol-3-phosphate dehydrogenase subunit B
VRPERVDLVVIGSGYAGAATAFVAREAGLSVVVLDRAPGASSMGSGALDLEPWESLAAGGDGLATSEALSAQATRFLRALGSVRCLERGQLVCTAAGVVRPARALDEALLDLGALEGVRVGIPRVPRANFDADALVRALGASPVVRQRRLELVAFDAPLLRWAGEEHIPDVDLAARHDDPARLAWLGEGLRAALARSLGSVGAVLLGPWLGAVTSRAAELGARLGCPVGELLVGVGSPAGARYEVARDALLERLGVARVRGRATRVALDGDDVTVWLEPHERSRAGEPSSIEARACVLAVGGLASGGLALTPPERSAGAGAPTRVGPSFALGLDAPLELTWPDPRVPSRADAATAFAPLPVSSALLGVPLDDALAPSGHGGSFALESVGVARPQPHRGPRRVEAAGDCLAGRARTALVAVEGGARVAERVAQLLATDALRVEPSARLE